MARLVIGLDFGTTYSGVAYCDESGAREGTSGIRLITQWPGVSGAANNEKVPSRICYGPNGEIVWGNQIRYSTKETVHACMKLDLDEAPASPEHVQEFVRQLRHPAISRVKREDTKRVKEESDSDSGSPPRSAKETVDIIADYLSGLRSAAYKEMAKCYGHLMFASMTKELVITVPAVWSERAKDLTIKAVQKANFKPSKIMLVSEPEAAAVYTLKGIMEGVNKEDIQVGDVFVLCDAGGGTVDSISYKITQVEPVLKMEEAAVGTGYKSGATYVDKEFVALLKEWLGTDAFQNIKPEKMKYGSPMMTAFEAAKFQFNGEDVEMDIPLPSDCGINFESLRNVEDNVLTLNADQMRIAFGPCIDRALELIGGQITSVMKAGHNKPKMVLVVGGFGRNDYLYQKITEYCAQQGIQTRQPPSPWSAIARGAVCRGLEGSQNGAITMRLARKFYGTVLNTPYDPAIHNLRDKFRCEITGEKMARDQVEWLCNKGDRLPEQTPATMDISVSFSFLAEGRKNCSAALVGCVEDSAPSRLADEAVITICRITGDLSDVPLKEFATARNRKTRKVYFKADFILRATFEPAHISWKMFYRGREMGSTTVSYDQ